MSARKRILVVFGTRPEAIKMAPLIIELKKTPEAFDVKVCVTAQHREMLDQVLHIFNITPDFDLNIMRDNQSLFDTTIEVLRGIGEILKTYKPDLVLVHGDTTTSMAAAMAAFYLKVRIGHVEAGLRTNDMRAPWPEEMNRQVTDRISDLYFVPTQTSRDNLLKENIQESKIFITGNTVIDALLIADNLITNSKELETKIISSIMDAGYDMGRLDKKEQMLILVTGHRRENFGKGFLNICQALGELATTHQDVDIVYPVHLNPNVRGPVYERLSGHSNIFLIPPVEYLPFIYLMKNSYLILTDSGGVQEEAPSFGKPVLVMRELTERPEAVKAGTVILVGTNESSIKKHVERLLIDKTFYRQTAQKINPYGDGLASIKICKVLRNFN